MRPLYVALSVLALAAACSDTAEDTAPARSAVTDEPPAPSPALPTEPAPSPRFVRTYSEALGDARGAGLDLSDTTVAIDDDGILTVDVAIPSAERAESVTTDNVQVYLDVDQDYDNSGYDVRFVLFGDAKKPFALHRWEREKWRDRTPASYEASFDRGVHIRVPAADVGIRASGKFDLFVASIDAATGLVSDLAPDGALAERWTYTR